TLLLEVEPALGRSRSRARDEPMDRLEAEQDEFFERVRATYLELASGEPDRIRRLDASAPPDQLLHAALEELADLV
ncbi:MAG: dTMP kinase, partial [Solirubrobacterales bacterium]|nr:dTMP kinase [Solirubrobacterales bacterium]